MVDKDDVIEVLRIPCIFNKLQNHTLWLQQKFARGALPHLRQDWWVTYDEIIHESLAGYIGEDTFNPEGGLEDQMLCEDESYEKLKAWIEDVFIRNFLDRYIVL